MCSVRGKDVQVCLSVCLPDLSVLAARGHGVAFGEMEAASGFPENKESTASLPAMGTKAVQRRKAPSSLSRENVHWVCVHPRALS